MESVKLVNIKSAYLDIESEKSNQVITRLKQKEKEDTVDSTDDSNKIEIKLEETSHLGNY